VRNATEYFTITNVTADCNSFYRNYYSDVNCQDYLYSEQDVYTSNCGAYEYAETDTESISRQCSFDTTTLPIYENSVLLRFGSEF